MAKEYVTKKELSVNMDRVFDTLDKIEEKEAYTVLHKLIFNIKKLFNNN